jgi:hypothetical protein
MEAAEDKLKNLYELKIDLYYGKILEYFLSTDEEVDGMMGQYLRFSEEAGKHSEYRIKISPENLRKVSSDQAVLAMQYRRSTPPSLGALL